MNAHRFRGRLQRVVYALRPNVIPAGQSFLWALAKEKGIPGLLFSGEEGTYEKPILDRLLL